MSIWRRPTISKCFWPLCRSERKVIFLSWCTLGIKSSTWDEPMPSSLCFPFYNRQRQWLQSIINIHSHCNKKDTAVLSKEMCIVNAQKWPTILEIYDGRSKSPKYTSKPNYAMWMMAIIVCSYSIRITCFHCVQILRECFIWRFPLSKMFYHSMPCYMLYWCDTFLQCIL